MPLDWLRNLRAHGHRSLRRSRVARRQAIPALESRVLLSAAPVTPEFGVNTFTTGDQRGPAVAADALGNFVVAWQSHGQDGSGNGIYAQRYDAMGDKVGGEFRVNTFTTGDQTGASVAMDADGDFVITWSSQNQDGSDYGVYAQRYNSAGVAVGTEFRVNTTTTGKQWFSSVGMDANGNFVVAWQDGRQFENGIDGNQGSIVAQRFDNTGAMVGSQFLVNTITTGDQVNPDVAMNASGAFVIVWNHGGGQLYDAMGNAVGGQFNYTSASIENSYVATVAMDDEGDFAVAWHSGSTADSINLHFNIFTQRFDAAGTKQGGEILVNAYTEHEQSNPDIAMDATGNFVVVWQDGLQEGYLQYGVYGQCFDENGNFVGDEFRVNFFQSGRQFLPSVAMNDTGEFAVAWNGDGTSDNFGINAVLFGETDAQLFVIGENRPNGFVVGTVEASNPNPVTFAITSGNTSSAFAINSSTGQITVNNSAAINFEVNPQFELTVTATEVGNPGNVETITVLVELFNFNEPPTFSNQTFGVLDTATVGSGFGKVSVIDPDQTNSYQFSIIGGNIGNAIGIVPETGHLFVNGPLNADVIPQYQLTVQLNDSGYIRTATVTVNVIDGGNNQAPVFQPPTTFSIAENRPVGTVVGDVNATDPDGDDITYTLVGGDPNGQFAINANTGVITVAKATINFEATQQFQLQVRATDDGAPSLFTTQTITVNITDLNEAPTFLLPTTFAISENRPVGYVVGDVNTFDPEGNNVTYSIVGGDPNAQFAIDANTGVITVAKATINFEATPQFQLQVRAQDDGAPPNGRTQTITVNVNDLNEAPNFLPPTTFSVEENSFFGTLVGTVQTFDPEGQTVSYSIVGGNTDNAFTINATSGQIRVANRTAVDFETNPQFLLQVRAQDNGSPSNSRTQTITVNVTDVVNESTAGEAAALAVAASAATPVGMEFQINSFTTGDQIDSKVAMDADGDFVVTWTSRSGQDGDGFGIYAQRFNAAGVAQGSEFQVNTYTTGHQMFSTVAMDADGDFVITWTSYSDGDGSGIFAQRYNAAGVAQGGEFLVNTFTSHAQFRSSVAMDADGDFVISWTSDNQEAGSGFLIGNYGIFAQRYNAAGAAQGGEFQVNTFVTARQQFSSVAMDADGDFVVTWESRDQDGSLYGLYGQRYNAAGAAQGSEFLVNTFTTNSQINSTVAMDADGDFVVAWTSTNGQDGSGDGVFAQRFNAAGVAQGSEFQVNTFTASEQRLARVAMDASGDFVVTWQSNVLDGSFAGVFAQRYDSAGVAQGSEFQVNTVTAGPQQLPAVAMDADGDFVVTWTSDVQDGSGYGIFAQRFTASESPVIEDQTFSISENRPVGYVVGTVAATDPEGGQLTYAITAGNTGNVFAIDASTGVITVASATINFEAISQYNLTVEVTDDELVTPETSSATITINIADLNEAPTFLLPTTFTISENRPVGQFVGDVNTFDPEGNAVTYSIVGGDPNAQFAIDANTGVITVAKATISFEATPQFLLQVRAQDNGTPANSRTQVITVNINDLNEAPGFLPPTTFAISENRPVGYVVGTVSTSDPEGNNVTYSIVGGDPNAQFAINATTGQITVAKATINFEATPQFLLQVRAQDDGTPSNGRTQTITVNINNLNEAPNFLPPTTFTIAENSPIASSVGQVQTFDPEGQFVSYEIVGGNTNGAFVINPLNGQIRVANPFALDFETNPQFLLQVRATDSGSPANSRTQTITINLTNIVSESPAEPEEDVSFALSEDEFEEWLTEVAV